MSVFRVVSCNGPQRFTSGSLYTSTCPQFVKFEVDNIGDHAAKICNTAKPVCLKKFFSYNYFAGTFTTRSQIFKIYVPSF